MSFFSRFFGGTQTEVVVLIDISSDSVGGAYVALQKGMSPVLQYTVRVLIPPSRELTLKKMEAALEDLLKDLITRGAPATRDAIGNARIGRIIVSVAPPWQETNIRTEHLEEKDSREFVFTHGKMQEAMHRSAQEIEGRIRTEEVAVAIMLNGYETPEPFGKHVKHADLVILSSHIESETEKRIRTLVSGAFHTHDVRLTSFVSSTHAVLRDVFPHEHDFLMLAISGEAADLVLIKQNVPRDIVSLPVRMSALAEAKRADGIVGAPIHDKVLDLTETSSKAAPKRIQNAKDRWLAGITEGLQSVHKRSPLPQTIFLIADKAYRDFAKDLLDSPSLRSLWLSDRPLSILAVQPSHLEPFIRAQGDAQVDLFLSTLALYAQKIEGK